MNEIEFVGLFFLVVLPVIASILGIMKYLTKPMIDLNTTMTQFKDKIDSLLRDNERQDERITCHGQEIDCLKETSTNHEVRIQHLEHYHRND